jgi:hypothetical protein
MLTDIQATIFPNPTSNELFIDFRNQPTKDMKIFIFDNKGVEKFKYTLNQEHTGYGIDVSDSPPPLFILSN